MLHITSFLFNKGGIQAYNPSVEKRLHAAEVSQVNCRSKRPLH